MGVPHLLTATGGISSVTATYWVENINLSIGVEKYA